MINDWAGIANGSEFSVGQKHTQRADQDLPEGIEAEIAQALGTDEWAELRDLWRRGEVDIWRAAGRTLAMMSEAQADTSKQRVGFED